MDNSTTTSQLCGDVKILQRHTSEVYSCAWSPVDYVLASGSIDSTARLWIFSDRSDKFSSQNGPSDILVLDHVKGEPNENVTSVNWNWDGTLLATGSWNGQSRIWSKKGELRRILGQNRNHVFSVWNKNSNYLLSGSSTAIVWDVKTYECVQQFTFHSGIILDVDWWKDDSFAKCSTDNMIYVCEIGESFPIKKISGHQGKVNCVEWDPTSSLLASCSDDHTTKIWSVNYNNHIYDFNEHTEAINCWKFTSLTWVIRVVMLNWDVNHLVVEIHNSKTCK